MRNGEKNRITLSKHMLWYSKEPSQWDGSFEHQKHMLQLIGKEIFTILRSKILYMRSQDASICFALCSFLCNSKFFDHQAFS